MSNKNIVELNQDDKNSLSNSTRRSFIQKSAIGTSVIASLASRPVWATGCSVSGQMSGNISAPELNNCKAKATGKSPGYWHKWKDVFDVCQSANIWGDVPNSDRNLFGSGHGNAVNVLFQWSVAAAAAKLAVTTLNLNPVIGGVISEPGKGIMDTSDQEYRHLIAGLLSAAHPQIAYPYPGNEWTVQYILQKYNGTVAEKDQLDTLQRSFLSSHNEPIFLAIAPGNNRQQRFNWAKQYFDDLP